MNPLERVRSFLTDYETEHTRVSPLFETGDDNAFDVWADACAGLSVRHGTSAFAVDGSSFSGKPRHSLANVALGDTITDGAKARIPARREGYPPFMEYNLEATGDDWRITSIGEYFNDPDGPAIAHDDAASRRSHASPDAPLEPLTSDDRPDPATLFAGRVEPAGAFRTGGVLAVGDFGYDLDNIGVLVRSIPAGWASVDFTVAEGRVAALRVRFSDAEVAAWRLASNVNGFVHGVHAANLAVFDWDAATSLSVRAKEATWDRFVEVSNEPTLLRLPGQTDAFGVICPSGWGDGAYPSYWGVDSHGVPVQLVLDFGVLPGAPWADGDEN